MVRVIEYDVLDDSKPEPEVFKARYEEVNGKKELVIDVKCKEIVHADGRRDVIIKAPSLSLINEFKKNQEVN